MTDASRTLRLCVALDDALVTVRRPQRAPSVTVPLGELVGTSSASFGLGVALLALTAIPFIGMSGPLGLAVALLGLQMLIGRGAPWLPARVRRFELSARTLERMVRWLERPATRIRHVVRPRLFVLFRGASKALVGLGLIILGVGLALPIPVPGSNVIFLVPILLHAVGLLEEDGVLVTAAHLATLSLLILTREFVSIAATFL